MAEGRAHVSLLPLAYRKAHFTLNFSVGNPQGNCRALKVEIFYFFGWEAVQATEQHWRIRIEFMCISAEYQC